MPDLAVVVGRSTPSASADGWRDVRRWIASTNGVNSHCATTNARHRARDMYAPNRSPIELAHAKTACQGVAVKRWRDASYAALFVLALGGCGVGRDTPSSPQPSNTRSGIAVAKPDTFNLLVQLSQGAGPSLGNAFAAATLAGDSGSTYPLLAEALKDPSLGGTETAATWAAFCVKEVSAFSGATLRPLDTQTQLSDSSTKARDGQMNGQFYMHWAVQDAIGFKYVVEMGLRVSAETSNWVVNGFKVTVLQNTPGVPLTSTPAGWGPGD